MNKFEDVDVIASLKAIMKQNTAFYQNDFDLDRNILQKAAASPTAEDRRLLWFSRPSGTSCFRERDVFLKGTRQHNTWRFYGAGGVEGFQFDQHGGGQAELLRVAHRLQQGGVADQLGCRAIDVHNDLPFCVGREMPMHSIQKAEDASCTLCRSINK